MQLHTALVVFSSIVAAYFVHLGVKQLFAVRRRQNSLGYPPGPPPSGSVTGHLKDMPAKKPWVTYAKWGKEYGDIIHLEALGDHIVILNSFDAANELLERRSRIYSGRPNEAAGKITGWDFNITFLSYTDQWRRARRTYQQNFRPLAVQKMFPLINRSVSTLLEQLLEDPDRFQDHLLVYSAGLLLRAMYGIAVKSSSDPLIPLGVKAVHTLDEIWAPSFLTVVTLCPFIRRVPAWVPFLGPMRSFIDDTRGCLCELQELPMRRVMEDIEAGRENDSLVANVLRANPDKEISADELERIKGMASTAYVASADTAKAQREIDDIIGRDRLPTIEDRKSLPYIEAVYREVMRWHPAVPLGAPHFTTDDDTYKDYYIPKNTMVLSNIWAQNLKRNAFRAMTRDERRYVDAGAFRPERFIDADGKLNDDDTVLAFGFGRRQVIPSLEEGSFD
ncbi:cytochrome p450 [Marasmius crinis-equi]|uniref:Cytochrome p450 n=1 Tax=Marasmius crinis-equi TaxID=585013 RepID=A0ABR3FD55_9AGAR